ncbi:beta-glucuronidase [Marinilactibacillus sp. XAAS-LB27]|uniref:beta-glucuronidase n=1 Tax=Marinilactibacillus sp. XAAS-LB27 TaxID=3114538 RepID=UPI002E17AAA3|nr:beta-glucuronidase [Marinilactibacillus sp. XAAS-LB27]
MLFPIQTTTRTLIDLSGTWDFLLPEKGQVVDPNKKLPNSITMAVPASFNDQITESKLRDYAGDIWYEKNLLIPQTLEDQRLVLRFGSVSHTAKVYFNGKLIVEHIGGFTPFEIELDKALMQENNDLKVCVSSILDSSTLPNAVHIKNEKEEKVLPLFDFFNYSGIHRPVKLYSTPQTYIEDIIVKYNVEGKSTIIEPEVSITGDYKELELELFDEEDALLLQTTSGQMTLENTRFWAPLDAYLYKLKVKVKDEQGKTIDTYTEEFGIRTFKVENDQFLINGKPFYFQGFGKHEDFPVLGKGMNEAAYNYDFNLMKWMGANSLRTAHYPYAEEFMRMADRAGIVVIDEVPGVGLFSRFNPDVTKNQGAAGNTWEIVKSFDNHKKVIQELIERDKNHACVVMWAVGNEPAAHQDGAREYFEPLINLARELDWNDRPVIIPNIVNATPDTDLLADLVDVICLNRYYGWYIDHGDLDAAKVHLKEEIEKWREKYPDKPIMFTEFGVDTIQGLRSIHDIPYTEEYQVNFFKAQFEVIDQLPYFIGEHIWNFADFETLPFIRRIDGNKKGVFTRERKPKMIAHSLKDRWTSTDYFGMK